MPSKIILIIALLWNAVAGAQSALTERSMSSPDNIEVIALGSDDNSSQFVIFVRDEVKAHKHVSHSESIYVIAGQATMRLGDKKFAIKPGDFVQVPQGVVHAVEVTSATPLQVLSVQAPKFDGSDRIWVSD